MGQVEAHDAVVGLQQARVDGEVGGRAREGLHVDAPLSGVELEGFERTLLAEVLALVYELVAGIVTREPSARMRRGRKEIPGARVALRVLVHEVGTHGLTHSTRRQVLKEEREGGGGRKGRRRQRKVGQKTDSKAMKSQTKEGHRR